MNLLQQLKLLMWKNFVIRRRQKVRVTVEVLGPLSLFVLLMLVRSKGLYLRVHECHFEDKPLPSAGQFLFWQGLVCSLNNTCHNNKTDAERNYSNVASSDLSLLLNDAQAFTEMTVNKNEKQFSTLIAQIGLLADKFRNSTAGRSNDGYTADKTDHENEWEGSSKWNVNLPYFMPELDNKTEFLTDNLDKLAKIHQRIDKEIKELEPHMEIVTLLKRINVSYENITDIIKAVPAVNDIFVRLHNFMCGNHSKITIDMMLEPSRKVDNLRRYLDSIQNEPATIEYQYDPDVSKECNAVYEQLETSPQLKFLWRFMKPFVRGKIIYAPNSTIISRIMSRVKSHMASPVVSNFKKEQNQLRVNQSAFDLAMNDLEFLSKLYKSHNSSGDILSTMLSKAFLPSVQKAHDLLKKYQEVVHELNEERLTKIGKQLSEILKCYASITVEHFSTEKEAEQRSMALSQKNELLALITFNNSNSVKLDPFVRYKIRMNAERISDSVQFSLSNGPNYKPFEDLKLITYGFIYLQDMVEMSIIREHTNRTDTPGYILKQLPHPCFVEDWFLSSLGGMFPMFMVLSWVYTSSMIIKSIVYEKEQKLRETMRVLGMNNGIHWCSWFLDSIIPMIVTVFVLSTVLVYGGVVANAEYTLVVLFLLCYSISTITMCFLVSVFFSKANLAASSGGIIFFITYLPFPLIDAWFPEVSPSIKELGSLLSNVALGVGSKYFALRELEGTGAKWSNVASSPLANDDFNIIKIMSIFIIDACLYFILAWYIENVFPGAYGIPKSWYYPFRISYWFPSTSKIDDNYGNEKDGTLTDTDTIEAEPTHLEKGVAIRNLTKIYKNGKVAIEQLSINFYQDQITAFLGTNGAGKTTTISILTGLFTPTSGTVEIYGQEIRTKMNYIRRSLGICPQYNILFPELTVQEHLWFFARLKGQTAGEVQVEVQTLLTDLGLYNKRDAYAQQLSGGMKRKLSIAIAFIGGSRTVVLDEPTAGVDPYARMGIWNLLLKYKKGRTIILTTHNMTEAELLGDRIAIVDAGKLVCCGSNSFLKSRFGWGYVLTIDCNVENRIYDSVSDVFENLIGHIVKIIPGAVVVEKFGTEIKFNLPKVTGNVKLYQTLLEFLITNKSTLGISSFGFSDTTLEEIFLKLTADKDGADKLQSEDSGLSLDRKKMEDSSERFWEGKTIIFCQQLRALLCKRLWRSRRNKLELAIQLLLPSILISVCMGVTKDMVINHVAQPKPLILDMKACPSTEDASNACSSFYQVATNLSKWSRMYVDSLKGPSGFGTSCVKSAETTRYSKSPKHLNKNWCSTSRVLPRIEGKSRQSGNQCSCSTGKFMCDFNASLDEPEKLVTSTNDLFYDISGQDVEEWILTSYDTSKNRDDKPETKRTGGFTFGVELLMKGRNITTKFDSLSLTGNPKNHKTSYPKRDEFQKNSLVMKKNLKMDPSVHLLFSHRPHSSSNISRQKFSNNFSFPLEFNNLSDLPYTWITNYVGKQLGITDDDDLETNSNNVSSEAIAPNVMDNIKIWFNNKWPLSPVVYLNGINNAVLRASVPQNMSQYYGIEATVQGMNLTWKQLQTKMSQKTTTGLLHSICILFSLSFVPASFTIYLIDDRVSGCKHLQLLSGVNWAVYWLHAFSWDLVCHAFSSLICVLTLICFQEEAYVGSQSLPSLTLLILSYGWSNIPLMYMASFFFKVTSSAFVALSCFNISVGVLTTAATYVLRLFEDDSLHEIKNTLANVFLIFPHFCLGDGLMKMTETYLLTVALAGFDVSIKMNLMAWRFLGRNLLLMFIEGIVFFVAVLCYEKFQRNLGTCSEQMMSIEPPVNLDDDVEKERRRILNLQAEGEVLVMKCLTKLYKPQNHVAVNQLCLGIDKGQCFGLIGLNGAGKTSTFKMLTGDSSITFGDATILGHSVRDNLNSVRSLIGYCPQFDALDSKLTPTEHLCLYASLRSIPNDKIEEAVNSCLRCFDLWKHRDICSRYLSGGNKRKLSTAIAILGRPQLIFLDEPTSGMDPKARRFLWSKIKDCVIRGQAVVLTSHSMSECEALCSRLSIMVNGQFMCLGSVQHLKNKFGKGYNLIVRVPLEKIAEVKKMIALKIPEGIEKSEHYTQIKYHLDVETVSLFHVLTVLEEIKEEGLIIDYSLSQKSLGEVFLNFVSHQSQGTQSTNTTYNGCRRLLCCPARNINNHVSSCEDL